MYSKGYENLSGARYMLLAGALAIAVVAVSACGTTLPPQYRIYGTILSQAGEPRDRDSSPVQVLDQEGALYPEVSLRAYIEGAVIVSVVVAADGSAGAVEVVQGVNPLLNHAAETAALANTYGAAMADGEPVESLVSLVYRFRLPGARQ